MRVDSPRVDRATRVSPNGDLIMFQLEVEELMPKRRAMVALWEEHLKPEMQNKDAHASCGWSPTPTLTT
jgi:hypothetical protein